MRATVTDGHARVPDELVLSCVRGRVYEPATLLGIMDALQHHYQKNRHHPEAFERGVDGMTLVDLVEMVCESTTSCSLSCSSSNAKDGCRIICVDATCNLDCQSNQGNAYPCVCQEEGTGSCTVTNNFN